MLDRADEEPEPDPDDVIADVADFVTDYSDDESGGSVQPLSVYLRRYPRARREVAAEYLRLSGIELDRTTVFDSTPSSAGAEHDGIRRVAHYKLIRLLGTGGQGEVWLAEDEALTRKVALKLLVAAFVTEDRRGRFRREAESIARLEHPGLAHVHDANIDGDPPFIAMRYVEGVDLGTGLRQAIEHRSGTPGIEPLVPWIPRNRRELHTVLRFFERCARALHAAHDAGVVHRDVKPGNIMITQTGEPVLLDFGLARGDGVDFDSSLTREGDVFGTLAYMAPEQLRGETHKLDARADVWALGVTLYEVLTGERPFAGKSPAEVAIAIEMRGLPDPVAKNPALTADVRVVLQTAIERVLERRYESALEFAEDLRRIAEFEPIHARPAGPVLRLARWVRREPALAAAVGATFLALTGGLAASSVANDRLAKSNREKDRANNALRAQLMLRAVPVLAEFAPAGALSLGLRAVALDDTWQTRSALLGPLLDSTLRARVEMPAARIWDVEFTGESTAVVAGAEGAIRLVSFSEDGTDCEFTVDGSLPEGQRVAVQSLAYDSTHATIWAGTADGRVLSFRSTDLSPLVVQQVGDRAILDLEIAADGVLALVDPATVVSISRTSDEELGRLEFEGHRMGALDIASHGAVAVVSPRRFHGTRRQTRSAFSIDTRSLEVRHEFEVGAPITDLAIADEAEVLALLDRSGTVTLHDLVDGSSLDHIEGGPLALHHALDGGSVGITPDASRLTVGLDGRETEVAVRGTHSYDLVRSSRGVEATESWGVLGSWRTVDIAFAPDRSLVALACSDNIVRVIESASGKVVGVHGEGRRPYDLVWTMDGSAVASIGSSNVLDVWRTRRSVAAFRIDQIVNSESPIIWGEFTNDGERVVLLDADGRAALFDTPRAVGDDLEAGVGRWPGRRISRLDDPGSSDSAFGARVAVAGDAPVAFWIGGSGEVREIDTNSGRVIRSDQLEGFPQGELVDIATAQDGSFVVAVDSLGVAWIWFGEGTGRRFEVRGAEPVAVAAVGPSVKSVFLSTTYGQVYRFAAPFTGEPLVAASPTFSVMRLQNLPRGQLRFLEPVTDLVVSPSGREVAAVGARDRLVTWDVSDGAILRRPGNYRIRRDRVVWVDDNRLLTVGAGHHSTHVLTGHDDGTAVTPDARHEGITLCGAVTGDGTLAITSSEDGSVLVWSSRSGEVRVRAQVHPSPVRWVDVDGTGDNVRVLSASETGAAIWPVDPTSAARTLAVRDVTGLEFDRVGVPRPDGVSTY